MDRREVFKFVEEKALEIGVTLEELRGKCRRGELALSRAIISKVLFEKFDLTYEEIADFLYKDRTAIYRAIQKANKALEMYEKLSGDKLNVGTRSVWAKLFGVPKQ